MEPQYEAPVTGGAGDGGNTGTTPPSGGQQNTGVQPPTPGGTGATPPSQTPSGASPAGNGQPPTNNGEWIPRTRLNDVTERARQEIARLQQELHNARNPRPAPTAPDPEQERIKEQFFQLFPNAKQLFALAPDKLESLIGAAPQFHAQTEHYWTNVGQDYLRQLEQSMQKVYGGSPDAKARRWIETAFIDWIQNDDAAKQRYLSRDPGLVGDFWQSVESLMLEPVRRSAIAGEQRRSERRSRLPVPGTGTQTLGKGPGPKPKDEDELHERAFEAFEASR